MDTQDFADLLAAYSRGDRGAFDQVVALVYDELRQLASSFLRKEGAAHTLQTTALVNEAYVRLVSSARVPYKDRAHFMAVAARTMRRVLVDIARARRYQKRDGGLKVQIEETMAVLNQPVTDIIAIHEALDRLARFNVRAAQVVEMKFFGGIEGNEIAAALGVSEGRVTQYYGFAKAWLKRELSGGQEVDHDRQAG